MPKQIYKIWVKHFSAVSRKHFARFCGRELFAKRIATVLREIRVRVRNREKAPAEGNVFARGSIGKTLTIEALVHRANGIFRGGIKMHRLEHFDGREHALLRRDPMTIVFSDV